MNSSTINTIASNQTTNKKLKINKETKLTFEKTLENIKKNHLTSLNNIAQTPSTIQQFWGKHVRISNTPQYQEKYIPISNTPIQSTNPSNINLF